MVLDYLLFQVDLEGLQDLLTLVRLVDLEIPTKQVVNISVKLSVKAYHKKYVKQIIEDFITGSPTFPAIPSRP